MKTQKWIKNVARLNGVKYQREEIKRTLDLLKLKTSQWARGFNVDFQEYTPFESKKTPTIYWSKYKMRLEGRSRFADLYGMWIDGGTRGE